MRRRHGANLNVYKPNGCIRRGRREKGVGMRGWPVYELNGKVKGACYLNVYERGGQRGNASVIEVWLDYIGNRWTVAAM